MTSFVIICVSAWLVTEVIILIVRFKDRNKNNNIGEREKND